MRAGEAFAAWLGECRDLLLPRGCAGCDAPDDVLCDACLARFRESVRFTPSGESFPCFACARYRGAVRQAVLAWKDHDDVELDGPFRELMAGRAMDAAPAIRRSAISPLLVVPAPSSPRSVRRRGRIHVRPLLRAACDGLAACGIPSRPCEALEMRDVRVKAVETDSARARRRRLDDRIAVRRRIGRLDGRHVVLVDDIVTTGATLTQCAAAIRLAGGTVVAAFALAYTPGPADCGAIGLPASMPRP